MDLNDLYLITVLLLIPTVFSMLFRLIGLGHKGQGRVALEFGVFILYLLIIPSILIDSMGYGNYSYIAAPVSLLLLLVALRFWVKPLCFMVDAIRTDWETLIVIQPKLKIFI